MFASAILGLAPEVWLAIIGLGLLAVATYTLRRHQK